MTQAAGGSEPDRFSDIVVVRTWWDVVIGGIPDPDRPFPAGPGPGGRSSMTHQDGQRRRRPWLTVR